MLTRSHTQLCCLFHLTCRMSEHFLHLMTRNHWCGIIGQGPPPTPPPPVSGSAVAGRDILVMEEHQGEEGIDMKWRMFLPWASGAGFKLL